MTRSSAPGSSNRWVAPGTIASSLTQRMARSACWLSAITEPSSPPTISSVGAATSGSREPARSGRPPRETTARTRWSWAAATRAAAAPVLAPK